MLSCNPVAHLRCLVTTLQLGEPFTCCAAKLGFGGLSLLEVRCYVEHRMGALSEWQAYLMSVQRHPSLFDYAFVTLKCIRLLLNNLRISVD